LGRIVSAPPDCNAAWSRPLVYALLIVALLSPVEEVSPARRAGAGATALVPGLVVHGAGHFVRGEADTGWRLLTAQGVGMAAAVGGTAGLAVTGASPKTAVPFIWMMIQGVGLFGVSWVADVYGSVNGPEGSGAPERRAPWLQLELGHRVIHDLIFDYGHLAVVGAEGRWRQLSLEGRGWFAADDDNQRARLRPAWRLWGPRPDRPAADGSFLDARAGVVWHRYGTERFTMTTGELALRGRLGGPRVGPTLRGLFFEAELGLAAGATKHEGLDAEPDSLLLGGFGVGWYLGHARDGWGELALTYDHRHDGYLAGAKLPGLGSGTAGHAELSATLGLFGPWGLKVAGGAGSAWMGGLSLLHRQGGAR
jgi:hypothetical protein